MVRDIHPAEVALKDGTVLTGVRVFVTTERCVVWTEDKTVGKVRKALEFVVFESDATPSRSTMGAGERFEVIGLTDGIIINKGRGCGCGSPLKALTPPVNWTR
jgi:hypothetical protein